MNEWTSKKDIDFVQQVINEIKSAGVDGKVDVTAIIFLDQTKYDLGWNISNDTGKRRIVIEFNNNEL